MSTALDALTDTLERMADWRDELEARVWRTSMLAELVGLTHEDLEELDREVGDFYAVALKLAERIPGSLVDHDREERRRAA